MPVKQLIPYDTARLTGFQAFFMTGVFLDMRSFSGVFLDTRL